MYATPRAVAGAQAPAVRLHVALTATFGSGGLVGPGPEYRFLFTSNSPLLDAQGWYAVLPENSDRQA